MAKDMSVSEKPVAWKSALVSVLGLVLLSFSAVSIFSGTGFASPQSGSNQISVPQAETTTGSVLGETAVSLPGSLASENYMLGQVVVGGDVTLASSDSESGVLAVSSVRGEAFLDKGKKDVNILVTWKTSKLSNATVRYGKNGGDLSKSIEEDGFGVNHSVILTGLDQATTYVYVITAKDRLGNEVVTDSYAVYTGTKSTSLFDLISGAVTDTFGWAIKK